jgi:hypothetical protein
MTNFFNFRRFFGSKANASTTAAISQEPSPIQTTTPRPAPPINVRDYTHIEPTRVDLKTYSYDLASKSLGHPLVLQSTLEEVLHGKIVDIRASELDREKVKDTLRQQLSEVETRKAQPEREIEHKQNVEIKDRERKIEHTKEKIRTLKEKGIDDEMEPYNPLLGRIYVVFLVLVTISSYIFYNSAVYVAFFRDVAKEIGQGENLNSLIAVIFNPNAISSGILAAYVLPFLFLAFGVGMFSSKHKNAWKKNSSYYSLLAMAILLDFGLSFIIHKQSIKIENMGSFDGVQKEASLMTALADMYFYIVGLLGIGVIFCNSILLENFFKEREKLNIPKRLTARVTLEEENIEHLEIEKNAILQEIMKLRIELDTLKHKAAELRELIERVEAGMTDVRTSINTVFNQWILYASTRRDNPTLVEECTHVFTSFKETNKEILQAFTTHNKLDKLNSHFLSGIFAILFCLIGLLFGKTTYASTSKPTNIILAVDLSDRMLHPDQAEIDQAGILKTWSSFVKSVSSHSNLFTARGCFQIVLIPQEGQPQKLTDISKKLSFNFESYDISTRARAFSEFNKALPARVKELYMLAARGNKHSDYPGVDIWGFFNQYLTAYLKPTHSNKLILLTDGYLDFEDKSRNYSQGNLSTTTHFLNDKSVFNQVNWKQACVNKGYGIIPLKFKQTFTALILEVRSKISEQTNPFRINQLSYIWQEWLLHCGIAAQITPHTDREITFQKIESFLSP